MTKDELNYFLARLDSSTDLSITSNYGTLYLDSPILELVKAKLIECLSDIDLDALEKGQGTYD